jgi:hypothetical protein
MISYSYRRLSEMLNAAERFNINTPFLWGHWGPVAAERSSTFFPNRTFSSIVLAQKSHPTISIG